MVYATERCPGGIESHGIFFFLFLFDRIAKLSNQRGIIWTRDCLTTLKVVSYKNSIVFPENRSHNLIS